MNTTQSSQNLSHTVHHTQIVEFFELKFLKNRSGLKETVYRLDFWLEGSFNYILMKDLFKKLF